MKFVKLVKSEITEEQKQAYLAEEQKANQLASKFGYKARISYDPETKTLYSITLDSEDKLKGDIQVTIKGFNGESEVRVHTKSVGSLDIDEYADFLNKCKESYECAKIFKEQYIA